MTLPAHKPTAVTREKVFDFKSFGVTNEEIANYLDISIETLTKYYRTELNKAVLDANASMAKSLYQNARDGDTTAQIFWLKTRGRWRSEDSKILAESNDDLKAELKALREKLDAQNKKEF